MMTTTMMTMVLMMYEKHEPGYDVMRVYRHCMPTADSWAPSQSTAAAAVRENQLLADLLLGHYLHTTHPQKPLTFLHTN